MQTTSIFSLMLLGGCDFTWDGVPLRSFTTRKEPGVLAYLFRAGQPQRRDYLAGLFWPGRDAAQGLSNLRTALTRLRRFKIHFLQVERRTVGFNYALPFWSDLSEFEIRARAGLLARSEHPSDESDLVELQAAAALYRGDFLAGLELPDAPRFVAWVTDERTRLRALVSTVLTRLVDRYEASGNYSACISNAQRLADLNPLEAAYQRRLMELLARDGRRIAALTRFEQFRALLRRANGTPDRDTMLLYERLRVGAFPVFSGLHEQAVSG